MNSTLSNLTTSAMTSAATAAISAAATAASAAASAVTPSATAAAVTAMVSTSTAAVTATAAVGANGAALGVQFSAADFQALKDNADFFFIIMNAILIFMMQAGFALLEAGSIRSHNTTNILLTNCMDAFVCCLSYWAVGFAFAHGEGGNFIGHTYWFGTFPAAKYAKWFFHFVFAAATPTIVSGALAERCDFYAYLLYSVLLTGFIYPVVSRWAWYISDDKSVVGWLQDQTLFTPSSGRGWVWQNGSSGPVGWLAADNTFMKGVAFQDFAGSGVVHLCGGTAALVAVVFLGPRVGRFNDRGKPVEIPGHSVPLTLLGGVLLMFGFFAFNGGSQFSISNPGDGAQVARAVVNTIISGSAAGITAMLLKRIVFIAKKWKCYRNRGDDDVEPPWSIITLINGSLTGMVAICSGCNVMDTWGAFLTGFFVALIYALISWLVVKLKIDDPVDALAVHFGGGLGGLLATPFMDATDGILVTRSVRSGLQLAVQLAGAVTIVAWTGSICIILFVLLKFTGLLRVSPEVEVRGLDVPKHHEPAYPANAYVSSYPDSMQDAVMRHPSHGQLRTESGELKASGSSTSMLSSGQESKSSVVFSHDSGDPQLRTFTKNK